MRCVSVAGTGGPPTGAHPIAAPTRVRHRELPLQGSHVTAIALAVLLVAAVIVLNIWATRAVLRDDLSTATQRTAQIAFVWFIPLLGALFALHFMRKDEEPSQGRYREIPNPGDDMVGSTHGVRAGRETFEASTSGPAEGGDGN